MTTSDLPSEAREKEGERERDAVYKAHACVEERRKRGIESRKKNSVSGSGVITHMLKSIVKSRYEQKRLHKYVNDFTHSV